MRPYVGERAHQRIGELSRRGMDLVSFWRECSEVITPAVPHYIAPCYYTLDPASLLVTSHYEQGLLELPREWLALEYYEEGVHHLADVARSESGLSTLHEATGGDPTRSTRYRRIIAPYGGEQEMTATLRTRSGEVWGSLGLYRQPGRPLFDKDELAFVKAVAPLLAEGARRALLIGEATEPEGPDAPGLIVLGEGWAVESMTPGAERWLEELPDGNPPHGPLPSVVLAVAGQALRSVDGPEAPGEIAFARVLSRASRWIVLHGAALTSTGSRRVAVIVEPAHPARITPLLMTAYQLTEREQDITRLVLQGNSTAEIAAALVVSVHTVQQHLKSVFEKTGVHSRRDLVGKIFFAHYEPRIRDNEKRAVQGKPLRGGPITSRHS
jgi:DNA-binding CsgD family transcriptional regulator